MQSELFFHFLLFCNVLPLLSYLPHLYIGYGCWSVFVKGIDNLGRLEGFEDY